MLTNCFIVQFSWFCSTWNVSWNIQKSACTESLSSFLLPWQHMSERKQSLLNITFLSLIKMSKMKYHWIKYIIWLNVVINICISLLFIREQILWFNLWQIMNGTVEYYVDGSRCKISSAFKNLTNTTAKHHRVNVITNSTEKTGHIAMVWEVRSVPAGQVRGSLAFRDPLCLAENAWSVR